MWRRGSFPLPSLIRHCCCVYSLSFFSILLHAKLLTWARKPGLTVSKRGIWCLDELKWFVHYSWNWNYLKMYIVHLVNLFSSVNVKVHEVHIEDNQPYIHSKFMAQLVGASPSERHRFEPRVVYSTPCTLLYLLYRFALFALRLLVFRTGHWFMETDLVWMYKTIVAIYL